MGSLAVYGEEEVTYTNGIPPMAPLASLVDRMRDLASEELPEPRTCKIRLWDDGTFGIVIYHKMAVLKPSSSDRSQRAC